MGGLSRTQVHLYRRFGDRMRVQGRPLPLLTTMGAKTGKVRQTVLCWFPDGDPSNGDTAWLVVASGAGSAQHPAWFVNMARSPDRVSIEVGGRQVNVASQSLRGAERTEAWQRVVALSPGYAATEQRTDREIPIVLLRPVT
jgi:deazaflavin-dependent oxidoreductase (nitroreductase family)